MEINLSIRIDGDCLKKSIAKKKYSEANPLSGLYLIYNF